MEPIRVLQSDGSMTHVDTTPAAPLAAPGTACSRLRKHLAWVAHLSSGLPQALRRDRRGR